MAFDFGEKRIGVAVGNSVTRSAAALATLHVESNRARLEAIAPLVAEWQPARLVIGEARYPDGRAHPVARLAHKFGNRLREAFRLPVEYVDETLSSAEAGQRLAAQGVRGPRRDAALDAVAAQVILQAWFEQQGRAHAA